MSRAVTPPALPARAAPFTRRGRRSSPAACRAARERVVPRGPALDGSDDAYWEVGPGGLEDCSPRCIVPFNCPAHPAAATRESPRRYRSHVILMGEGGAETPAAACPPKPGYESCAVPRGGATIGGFKMR